MKIENGFQIAINLRFLIIGEVLSCNITAAINLNQLQHMKLSANCPGLSYFLFADDALFFMKATTENCQVLCLSSMSIFMLQGDQSILRSLC